MSKYTTVPGLFYVEIEDAPKSDAITSSRNTASAEKKLKKVTILHTFDDEKYPVGSVWMMGEVPGMKLNFFGEKFIAIQEKDLYARIN